jgi:hypothetical protein
VGAALAFLAAGCETWPVLVREPPRWRQEPPPQQPVRWDSPRPASAEPPADLQPEPGEVETMQVRQRVNQYVSSIDSLADRVARYEQESTETAPSGASGTVPIEAIPSQPKVVKQPEPVRVEPRRRAVPPVAQTPVPPTVVAVEVRPANSAESLADPVRHTEHSNLPLQGTGPARQLDLGQVISTVREQVARQPNRADKQFVLRLLYILEGRDDLARAAFEGTDAEIQQAVGALVEAMIAARPGDATGPVADADRTLSAIDEFRQMLRSRAALRVPTVTFCKRVLSFGVYDRIEPLAFPAGREQPVILYCEVENFQSRATTDGQFETLLTFSSQIYSTGGKEVYSQPEQKVRDLCRKRRNDFFIRQQLYLPGDLAPDYYVTKVAITDLLAGKRAEGRVIFQVLQQDAVEQDRATTTSPATP